ncbi:MAG: RcnB family protein [Herbaspirillum sp.]
MNKKPLIAALAVFFMAAGSSAFAQNYDRQNDHGRHEQAQRGHNQSRAPVMRHDDRRGAGPRHDMRRGQRLPAYYRGQRYVVNDWRGHHLHRPPRGYYWVQAGGDYVLVAAGTGLIVQLMLN